MQYLVDFIEVGFSLTMIINALLFLPQIFRLYQTKDYRNLSALTFVGFNIIQLFAILHGYINNDYALMYGMLLSFVLCLVLNILALYYRVKQAKS